MKPSSKKWLLLGGVLLLLALNVYLLRQNGQYRQQNRTLILQNDSILSVNLELKQAHLSSQATALSAE